MHKRIRYFLGNCYRLASSPWRSEKVTPDLVTTIFGCGFGDAGWHHIRKTLEQYDRDPDIDVGSTVISDFLTCFQPKSISDLCGVEGACDLPLFVYPWGTFIKAELESTKEASGSRFCGPSDNKFIEEEYNRTISLYEKVREDGYKPYKYPNSHVGGVWLISKDGDRRFVVLQGNHRMAILAHLGFSTITVRGLGGKHSRIYEKDVGSWPMVLRGDCSKENALKVFRFFFLENGFHIANGLTEAASE